MLQELKDKLKHGAQLMDEGDTEIFLIVTKGKVDVEHEGKKMASIRVGQHFGVEALFHKRAASCTIECAVDDTTVLTLTRKTFERVAAGFNAQAKESMLYNVHHHLHQDEHGDIVEESEQVEESNLREEKETLALTNQSPRSEVGSPTPDSTTSSLGEGLLDSSSVEGVRENRKDLLKVVETEELAERVLAVQFQRAHRKHELTTELEVHSCCLPVVRALQPIGVELGRLYAATLDPTARSTALLETMIALYGPLTLQAMSVLFCRDVPHVNPEGVREIRSVLVVDSTKACEGPDYDAAKSFSVVCLAVFCIGVPVVMLYAAKVFYMTLTDNSMSRTEAVRLAKTRFHSSWKEMDKQEKNRKIDQCAHEIRLKVMGQSSFLLSTFQMCVERRHAYWYPQWHLVRRTFLNYVYFDALRSGDNTTGLLLVARYDWRVVVAIVLIVSNVLQQYSKPFRDEREDQLEAWSLHLLTLVVVIDIADSSNSIYACAIVSAAFAVMVANDKWHDFRQQRVAQSQWHNLRKLQVETGKIGGNGVEAAATTSMLKIKLAAADKQVRPPSLTGCSASPPPTHLLSSRDMLVGMAFRRLVQT